MDKKRMRGGVLARGKGKWALVLNLGYRTDPTTGKTTRLQKWVSFTGKHEDAVKERAHLLSAAGKGALVLPAKQTFGEWLATWLKAVEPSLRPRTMRTYRHAIDHDIRPALGDVPVQKLTPAALQEFYGKLTAKNLSPATVRLRHAIVCGALRAAVKNGLVVRNVANLVEGLPTIERTSDDLAAQVWSAEEARKFLAKAKLAGSRQAALFALALDSGARLRELAGLKWDDINFSTAKMTLVRQLATSKLADDRTVQFGPLKRGRGRVIDLNAETVNLLRDHKRQQAELKLKFRTLYDDHGLVFSKEQPDMCNQSVRLGTPVQADKISSVEFQRIVEAAGVKRIPFHGCRHTSATLLLMAGVPVKVVSERLGHAKSSTTMDIYSHVLPSMGRGAADQLGAILHG